MPTTSTPQFITAREAAACIGITKSTMYDWINRGYLPHHRIGRLVRIQRSDLESFIRDTRMNDYAGPRELEAQSRHFAASTNDGSTSSPAR
jgi:excisionase family DNA binding protein